MPPRRSKKPSTTVAAAGRLAARVRPSAVAGAVSVVTSAKPPAPTEAERRRAEKLVASVKSRKRRIASDFYEQGKDLAELADPRSYRALGYATFEDLLSGRQLMSRIQAHKLIEVARAYPKPIALSLGIEKAYALHRYVVATPAADIASELARRDARIGRKAISRLSVDDLREAARLAERGLAPGAPAVPAPARARARELQRALRKRGAKSARVRAKPDGAGIVLEIRLALDDADAVLP